MSQWSVGSKIGKGSFASVYVGTHKVSTLSFSPCIWSMSVPPSHRDPGLLGFDEYRMSGPLEQTRLTKTSCGSL